MKLRTYVLIICVGLLIAGGCKTTDIGIHAQVPVEKKKIKKGPPPHAPAHGYRHKHQGHDLSYDTKIGAYIVVNVPDTYFYDDLYIRLSTDGDWLVSATLGHGWRMAVGTEVPNRLKHKKEHKYKKKKTNKGQSKKY